MDSLGKDLLTAFALVLIIEGLLPLLAPQVWIRTIMQAVRLGPRGIRLIGIICTLAGAIMLQIVR